MPQLKSSNLFIVFLYTICVLSFSSFFGQNVNIDSLRTIVNGNKHDTIKLKALSFIMINTSNASPEFETYNEKVKTVALQLLNKKKVDALSKEKAYDALAVYYTNKAYQTMQSDYLLTIKNLNKSLEYFSPKYFVSDKYKGGRAYVLMSLGVMNNKIGNTEQSITNYFEALKVFENLKNKSSISYALQSIGNLYFQQKKYKQALSYFRKAYEIYYKKSNLSFQDSIQKVLLFINIAQTQQELNQCEQSDLFLDQALNLAQQLNDNDVLSEVYFNIGKNEERCKKDKNNALIQYRKSLFYSKLPENNANSYIAIGRLLAQQSQFSEAEQNLSQGLAFAKKINHLEFQKQALDNLYLVYKAKKQYDKALEIGELSSIIKDSIKKEQNDNLLTKKQLQYEFEAKQSQLQLEQERKLTGIKLENQKKNAFKNSLLIGLFSILLVVCIGAYFLNKNYKQKQAIAQFEKNALSQKLLLSQMNPHFIFNSIDTIQSLIYSNQSEQAVNYLTKFSKLTRQILENSNENYISLEEELLMLDNYLTIQKLLYNNKFDYNIQVSGDLETELIFIPPMLTQPFIENSIKHGLKNTTQKGSIIIRFELHNDQLFFEITDNGMGFNVNEKSTENKSLAMKITKERLKTISRNHRFEVVTENVLDTNANVIGAKVSFEIPYIYEN